MQRETVRSSQLGLTSGIRRESSEFVATPRQDRFGRGAGRRGKLWILTEPASASGGATAAAKLVMETIEDEYYQSPAPSITTALEEAVQAANRLLHDYNSGAPSHKQAYLGISCVVLHGKDVYIAQVQPARVIVVHQGTPRSFPEGPPRAEVDLTPLGLDTVVHVELSRSPYATGDIITLMSAGLAQIVARAEDEYGLSYQDHAGAAGYLAHLAARENLLDEHAVVLEEPARRRSGVSLESLGRDWVGEKLKGIGGPLGDLRDRATGQLKMGLVRAPRLEGRGLHLTLPLAKAGQGPTGKPSHLQIGSTILGVLLLFALAAGLGSRAYQGYQQTSRFEDLLGSAEAARQEARGKPADVALQNLKKAERHLEDARRIDPADPRPSAELARIKADRERVNKVVRVARPVPVATLPRAATPRETKMIVLDNRLLILDKKAGTVRLHDLKNRKGMALSPRATVRFVGLSWRDGGALALDRTGRLWDYDFKSGEWSSFRLPGKQNWSRVVSFDTYGSRAFVAITGKAGVLAYDMATGDSPKVLSSNVKKQPLSPVGVSADSNLWVLNGRDNSISKLSNDRVSRRLWVSTEPTIEDAFGLLALDTNKYLYLLDEQRNRVLQIAATGQLQAQLWLPSSFRSGARIDAFYADEASGNLYLTIGKTVYKAPLPKPVSKG